MNKLKAKERYYAVRVSKGPFCPEDLFEDVRAEIKKQHEHSYASFVFDRIDSFEIGNYSEDSSLMSPELLVNCIKGDIEDITKHRYLSDLFIYKVVWYDDN